MGSEPSGHFTSLHRMGDGACLKIFSLGGKRKIFHWAVEILEELGKRQEIFFTAFYTRALE